MASAQEQLYDQKSYDTSKPLSYEQWQDQATSKLFGTGNFWNDFANGFTQWWRFLDKNDPYIGQDGYNRYLEQFRSDQNAKNASIAEYNQRKYDEYMSSTAYQRAYQDIKATGLNPAILLTSAFGPASHGNSAQAYSWNSNQSVNKSESKNRNNSASAIIAALIFLLGKMV